MLLLLPEQRLSGKGQPGRDERVAAGSAATEGGALEHSLDAASGTFCHFRRCRSPMLLLLQVKVRRWFC